MCGTLDQNIHYAQAIKDIIGLRYEPVAIKLVKTDEEYPEGYKEPVVQQSHCQALFRAKNGMAFKMPLDCHNCMVGASALNLVDTSDKVASGEFHVGIGIHDSEVAASKMIQERMIVPFRSQGEVVCPLKEADFVPDIVAIVDIPERVYWVVALATAEEGGRMEFSTSPFQCACEDVVAVPMCTGKPNISLGCFGCRRRTDMRPDEVAAGIPYAMIPSFVEHLGKYKDGVMAKAKRD